MRGIGRRKGFTLVELLVVITIIGILAALVTVTVQPIQKRARDSKRRADITLVRSAADLFKADFKIYPNYTYYLGRITTDSTGTATQSYFDLGADLASCYTGTIGNPTNFVANGDGSNNTTAFLGMEDEYDVAGDSQRNWQLRNGFPSVNHFLACLKYIDRVVQDPSWTSSTDVTNYWYGVSYDYSEIILSAKAENTNDKDSKSTFYSGGLDLTPKRFFEGNGLLNQQFDEKSNSNTADGKYLYQCTDKSGVLSFDKRSLTTNYPLNTDWTSACTIGKEASLF